MSTPRHGETRRHGLVTTLGGPADFVLPDGSALDVPAGWVTESVCETYCAHCKQWVATNGVHGALVFMARHRDGDCQKAGV